MTEKEFDSLYKKEHPRILRICRGYTSGDSLLAEEWAQEVFIRIWQHIHTFQGKSQLSTWIYRIAVNTCLQNLRTARRRREQPQDPERIPQAEDTGSAEMEEKAEKEERLRALYRYIDEMMPTNRTIILLELEGVPQKEIAEITGLSHQAIRTRMHRIKADIQKQWNHEYV